MKKFLITFKGQQYELDVEEVTGTGGSGAPKAAAPVAAPQLQTAPAAAAIPKASPAPAAGGKTINAPMPGKILTVKVKPGDSIKRGDVVIILEAMKMQNEIMAPSDGKVAEVRVSAGSTASSGDVLIVLG